MKGTNTSESTKDLSTNKSIEEQLKEYVRFSNGAIFRVLQHPTKQGLCYLNAKHQYILKPILEIKYRLVKEELKAINEHELRKFLKEEDEFNAMFTQLLVKRILYSQLLIELDDGLLEYFADDKYIRGLLDKLQKQTERLIKKQYEDFYNLDKQIVMNFLKHIEKFIEKVSKLGIDDFYQVNEMLDVYLSNPEAYKQEQVLLDVIE